MIARLFATALALLPVALAGCIVDSPAPDMAQKTADMETPLFGPLRSAIADTHMVAIGASVLTAPLANPHIPLYAATFAREFNYLTAETEMLWNASEPSQGKFDFTAADQLLAFATAHGQKMRGHTLVWDQQLPDWVGKLEPDDLRAALVHHIQALVTRYRGKIRAWDVVNEAVEGDGTLKQTLFLDKLGPGYLALAYQTARAADPDAVLIYNDYDAEGAGAKSDGVYTLVKGLLAAGVPIDEVGLEMHIDASGYPLASDIAANLARLAALGLKVSFSEMDVRIDLLSDDMTTKLALQQQVYHDDVAACVAQPACEAVTTWGFSDAYTWFDSMLAIPDADPLPFDALYRPKPAYYGLLAAVLRR